MDFNEYQEIAGTLAIYPDKGNNITYPTLGIAGEAGEVADKIKKILRDDGGVVSDEKKEDLKLELGDVLWYISALADELGLTMDEIVAANVDKLLGRRERGTLGGSGDHR